MSNFQIRPHRPARPLFYLAPAIALLVVFFLAPIAINAVIAFTDMGASLRVGEFTMRNFERIVQRDARIPMVLLTTLIYVTATLFIFNVGLGALLAMTSTAIPDRLGNFSGDCGFCRACRPPSFMASCGYGSPIRHPPACSIRLPPLLALRRSTFATISRCSWSFWRMVS